MASPQTEDGYTRIANELMEALCRASLSQNQFRVCLAIIRKTYGYGKKEDRISLSQFEKMTGILSQHVKRTLGQLEKMNMITVDKVSHMKIFYGIQKDYEQWSTTTSTGSSRKKQLLPAPVTTTTSPGSETTTSPGSNKRNIKK